MRHGWAISACVALLALMLGGSALATSKAVPANTTPPKITGSPQVGQTLTTDNGTWTGSPTTYEYQWLRCNAAGGSCVSEPNGTSKTYTLIGADRGHTIRVRVTATNADGSTNAQSSQTAVVTETAGTPRNTDAPIISGTPEVGETLETDEGSWTNTPTGYTFHWQRCDADNIAACADVPGATSRTYVLHTGDLGYRMRVRVTARNASGSASATSATTAVARPVAKVTNTRPTLTIVSVRFVGQTIYARFRVCDDSYKSLTIIATDSRPGKASYTRRFTTVTAPQPCGVYTRHWVPASRFHGAGRFTVTLSARDKSGSTSSASHRTFSRG